MLASQKIDLRRSEIRARLSEISALEGADYSDEIKGEEKTLHVEIGSLETRYKSAVLSESDEQAELEKTVAGAPDAETRERLELRSKAQLTNYFQSYARGKLPSGAEAELSAAAGVSGGIPIELWDVPQPEHGQTEKRAVAALPGTTGINLDPVRPFVFSNSIAPKLGIDMPRVASGTFASATISTSQSAEPKAKGAAAVAVAGAMTVTTAVPKRISARLELSIEDISAVGQANYESALRETTSMALSDEFDNQAINGDGSSPNLFGIIQRLEDISNPVDPGTTPDFDDFVESFVDSVDGLWSATEKEVSMIVGPATYRLAGKAFRDIQAADLGAIAFADYARQHYGSFSTNKRMPLPDSTIQQAIVYRMGRSMLGGSMGMRTAVCPHWGEIGIDDVYSGSAQGERYFTLHVLVGDVILVQPDAYALREFKVA